MENPADKTEALAIGLMLMAIFYTLALVIFINIDDHLLPTYMTLWAAVIALCGAWLTVRAIRDQIQSNLDIEREREQKLAKAARAMLPITLAEISKVSQHNMPRNFSSDSFLEPKSITDELQTLDTNAFENIREYIPLMPEVVSERISKIVALYQMLMARDTKSSPAKVKLGIDTWEASEKASAFNALNWAIIYAQTGALYKYARGDHHSTIEEIGNQDVFGAIYVTGLQNFEGSKLNALLSWRLENVRLDELFSETVKLRFPGQKPQPPS